MQGSGERGTQPKKCGRDAGVFIQLTAISKNFQQELQKTHTKNAIWSLLLPRKLLDTRGCALRKTYVCLAAANKAVDTRSINALFLLFVDSRTC